MIDCMCPNNFKKSRERERERETKKNAKTEIQLFDEPVTRVDVRERTRSILNCTELCLNKQVALCHTVHVSLHKSGRGWAEGSNTTVALLCFPVYR